MRFLHAADLHLGAASQAVLAGAPDVMRNHVEQASYRAWERLVAEAVRGPAAFVVLSGDLLNTRDKNLRARLALRRGYETLREAGIPVVAIRGNHDYEADPDQDLPGIHTFSPQPELGPHEVAGASLYGISFGRREVTENLAARYPKVRAGEGGLVHIALLHGNPAGETDHASYAPFELDTLRDRGYDYWALGHVHTRRELSRVGPWACYSGCLQGSSPRETGPKGALWVTYDDGAVTGVEFVGLDVLRWERLRVDVTGALDPESALESALIALRQAHDEADRPLVARVELVGLSPAHAGLRNEAEALTGLRDALQGEEIWVDALRSAVLPEIDWDALAGQDSVRGALVKAGREPSPELLAAVRTAFVPLLEKTPVKELIEPPDEAALRALLLEASQSVVAELEEGP